MKLKFCINYRTEWGQSIHVLLTTFLRNGRQRKQNLLMQTQDGEEWTVETALMEARQQTVESVSYTYQLEDGEDQVLRREWLAVPRTYAVESNKSFVFTDQWQDRPLNHHLYTLAYYTTTRKSFDMIEQEQPLRLPLFRKTIIFRVSAPQLKDGQLVGIIGNHPAMGNWNPTRYLPLQRSGEYDWMLSVNVDGMTLPLEYKYVVVDGKTRQLVAWEDGDNRVVEDQPMSDGQVFVKYADGLRIKEQPWRLAGMVIPVFSLRSEHSFGVGDFGDLKRMVEWAATVGMRMLQILPVNDTTSTHGWTDSHPYDAISCFALHPHYLDLEQLGPLADEQKMTAYQRQRRELNALPDVDYLAVARVKASYVADAFAERGAEELSSAPCKAFVKENESWLIPYAVFCVLRDEYHTARFTDWKEHARYQRDEVKALAAKGSPYYDNIQRIIYVQYHLHLQLAEAAQVARQNGVALKGDLPIGVYRDSVETWMHPDFFDMKEQLGVPPDGDNPHGQNWGFPAYRWPMADEGPIFEWWHRRLRWMEQYFDALRIDHVIGFFRSWLIPTDSIFGSMGHFEPSLPLSEEEIGHAGLVFRKELFTRPFINHQVLDRIFGLHASYVKENFLVERSYGLYDLKDEVASQTKIRNRFHGLGDENSLWIRDGLYRLVMNVLFLEDPHQEGMYHPRFGAFRAPVYEVLSTSEKDAYMRIYNNYFYERHNDYWAWQAMRRLSAILSETRMLVCAEDLGLLPACVSPVLDALRIFTLEVQHMPKQHGYEFAHLNGYPVRSVATFSTHDMPTMRLWWEEHTGRTQRYYTTMMQREGKAPRQLSAPLATEIVARHLYCPSMICMLSLQDWLATDGALRCKDVERERINEPFDSYQQWKYRMHLTIEQLMHSGQLNGKIQMMIQRSQR